MLEAPPDPGVPVEEKAVVPSKLNGMHNLYAKLNLSIVSDNVCCNTSMRLNTRVPTPTDLLERPVCTKSCVPFSGGLAVRAARVGMLFHQIMKEEMESKRFEARLSYAKELAANGESVDAAQQYTGAVELVKTVSVFHSEFRVERGEENCPVLAWIAKAEKEIEMCRVLCMFEQK